MRALFLRFYRFAGPLGLIMILMGVTIVPLEIFMGVSNIGGFAWKSVAVAIIAIIVAIMAAPQYTRSSRTVDHKDILLPLVRSEREYCLVLRPFGRDGEIILPKADYKNRVGMPFVHLAQNMTMEQLVATAALGTLGLETYGIVDQNILFAPPGVTFIRVSNDEWKTVVQRLIRRAHSIFLIMPPDQDMREGFAWEIEQIVCSGMQSRVIIMLPPCDRDVHAHQTALRQACVILALLDDSGRQAELNHFKAYEYELQLSATTLIVRYKQHAGATWWGTVPKQTLQKTNNRKERKEERKKKFVADKTYLPGLAEALQATERELSGLSFKARYPPI